MEINAIIKGNSAQIIVEFEKTKMEVDVTRYTTSLNWHVPEDTISQFFTSAVTLANFNGENDLEFFKRMADRYLNSIDRAELAELLANP